MGVDIQDSFILMANLQNLEILVVLEKIVEMINLTVVAKQVTVQILHIEVLSYLLD